MKSNLLFIISISIDDFLSMRQPIIYSLKFLITYIYLQFSHKNFQFNKRIHLIVLQNKDQGCGVVDYD